MARCTSPLQHSMVPWRKLLGHWNGVWVEGNSRGSSPPSQQGNSNSSDKDISIISPTRAFRKEYANCNARWHHWLSCLFVSGNTVCVRRNNIVTTWWQRYCHQVHNPQAFMQRYKGPSSGFWNFSHSENIALTVTTEGEQTGNSNLLTSQAAGR